MISVYAKRNMKRNEMVGWFSLGLNSSGPEEAQHFNDMRDAANINGQVGKCDLIARWHVLVVSDLKFFLMFAAWNCPLTKSNLRKISQEKI